MSKAIKLNPDPGVVDVLTAGLACWTSIREISFRILWAASIMVIIGPQSQAVSLPALVRFREKSRMCNCAVHAGYLGIARQSTSGKKVRTIWVRNFYEDINKARTDLNYT